MFVSPLSLIQPPNSGSVALSGAKPSARPKRRRCSSLSEVAEMNHYGDDAIPVVAMETYLDAPGASSGELCELLQH